MKLSGGPEAQETAKFAEMFNCFFDCLNVNSFEEGKNKRKHFKHPYRSGNDFRLKVAIILNCIIMMHCVYVVVERRFLGLLRCMERECPEKD